MSPSYAILDNRSVIHLGGPEAKDFLQGLITNDVEKLETAGAIYGALLTPQGKFLHDFIVFKLDGGMALDCEAARKDDLIRRLTMYRLRSKVTIEDVSDGYLVAAMWDGKAAPELDSAGALFPDPRVAALGWRAVLARDTAVATLEQDDWTAATPEDYDRRRLALGVPDGSRDLLVDKSFLLEGNFEELNGVDFDKGCYVGQENTTRQKHRGVVRKRFMRVDIQGPTPAPGTPVMLGDKEAGTMRSSADGAGMALLRLEYVTKAEQAGEPLVAGEARLTPVKPDWASF